MPRPFTAAELEAYLDEQLAPDEMAAVEKQLRKQQDLAQELVVINTRREKGVHSIGGIWRRSRLSCPARDELGSYLLSAMDKDHHLYVKFHLEVVGCRYCLASVEDLQAQQEEAAEEISNRRRKYFQTSAGYLPKE